MFRRWRSGKDSGSKGVARGKPVPRAVSGSRRNGLGRLASRLRGSRTALTQAARRIRERRIAFSALVFGATLTLALVAWPFAKAHLQAIAVLQLVSGKPVPKLIAKIVAEPIKVQDLNFQVESGTIRARIYTPENKPNAPALIVLHGVHHLGIDEPRLESFAAAMASCGLRVLTPELPDIKDYHVDQSSIKIIGESTQWFAKQTGGPAGVMGLSFSGGLALIAASDPLYGKDFKFVFAVGSQDRMDRVAEYYRTGEDVRPNGTTEVLPAHEYGPLVLEYEYVEDFVPRRDVAAVRSVLRAHLYEDKAAEEAAAAKLNEVQKREALELMDAASPATRALIAKVTAKHISELDGLSPGGRLKKMTTPVYLLHGQADNIIPSAETLWMASELPAVSLQAMLVSPVLSHIDFEGSSPGVWDQWRLIHFFALVLRAAESK
jgi:pimeloyl-ACP methyl ester carboxylesterase